MDDVRHYRAETDLAECDLAAVFGAYVGDGRWRGELTQFCLC
jgi:hypothetical protein